MARQQRPDPAPRGPLTRPLRMRDIPEPGLDTTIEATPAECAAIAASAGVETIADFQARFRIDRRSGGRLDVTGTLDATVTQVCVVTLEPFEERVSQPIEIAFAPAADERWLDDHGTRGRDAGRAPATMPSPASGNDDQIDPPDAIVDDRIDLGDVAVEFFVLSLDPYPKKPDSHFNEMVVGDDDEPDPSPFAALARLKDRT